MSRLRLRKKFQPINKAWKSFSNTLQSKVHKLNFSKAIKATFKRLLGTLHFLHHLTPSKNGRRSLTSIRPYATSNHHAQSNNISAMCIDDVFAKPASSMHVHENKSHAQGETSRSKEAIGKKDLVGGSSGFSTIEDAWKAVVAKSPQLHVDEKAEEFISKFHEDMRLQKERSLLEFQERLARSA